MITLDDLNAAIAECQGERNPNANTCMKLAAFYTIRNELYGNSEQAPYNQPMPNYSMLPAPAEKVVHTPTIDYTGDSEFAGVVHGQDVSAVMAVIDELMQVLQVINPRLYSDTMYKLC